MSLWVSEIKTRSSHFRFIIIALLFVITVINYIDRSSIAYAIGVIRDTFHLSDTQFGWVLGIFGLGYVVTTFLGGIAVDHYGARITLVFSVVLWSLSLFLTGLSVGFVSLLFARFLLGVAEGPNFPAMTRAIGDWLPVKERVAALSYSLMSVPVALAIGGPLVSQLILHISWRGMFHVLGAVAFLWVPFWWFLFKDFPEKSKFVNKKELHHIREEKPTVAFDPKEIYQQRKGISGLWKYLFSNVTLLANYWSFFVFGYYLFFFMTWLPDYLSVRYKLHLATVGLFTVLPWTFAAVLMWVCGYLSDYVYKKTKSYRYSRSYVIWVSQLLAALSVIPVIYSTNLFVAIALISLAVGFGMCSNGAFYAVNIDIAKERAGTALGIMDAFFAASGFLAPLITGWLSTVTGRFNSAFWLLVILGLSSVVVVVLFHHPEKAALKKVRNH